MTPTIPYLACLCGAREDDHGQERPRKCWHCGERTMGRFDRGASPMADAVMRGI